MKRTEVSAGAIILRDIAGELKVALAQHKNSARTWVLPKGHVEPGESLEQAALREIHEEAGLPDIRLIKYLGAIKRRTKKNNGNVVEKTIHYYLAYALGNDQLQNPPDPRFTEVGWFLVRDAAGLLSYKQERIFLKEQLEALFASSPSKSVDQEGDIPIPPSLLARIREWMRRNF